MASGAFTGANTVDQIDETKDLISGLKSHSGTYFEKYGYEDLFLGEMIYGVINAFEAVTKPTSQWSVTPKGSDRELHMKTSLYLRGFEREYISFDWRELGLSEEDKNELIDALNELTVHERQIAGIVNPWLDTTLEEKDREIELGKIYPEYKYQIPFNDSKTPDEILKGVPKQICAVLSDKSKDVLLKNWDRIIEYAASAREYDDPYCPDKKPVPEEMIQDMKRLGALIKQTMEDVPMAPAATVEGFKPRILNGGKVTPLI